MTENNTENNNISPGFEAALADLWFMAQLYKQQARPPFPSPPDTQTDAPPPLLPGEPLKLAEGQPDPRDARITEALLNAYQRDDGWHCPKCGQVFTEPTPFAQHLIDELNRGLSTLPKPRIDAHPPATPGPTKPENT